MNLRISLLLVQILLLRSSVSIHIEKSESTRNSRALSYAINGGTYKLVLGMISPVPTEGKPPIAWGYNLQAQYAIPANPIHISNKWNGRSLETNRNTKIVPDTSRMILYNLMELFLNRKSIDGRECILRAICDVNYSSLKHNGVFGELIDLVFTPGEEKIHSDFQHALEAGRAGADCLSIYKNCPVGDGILNGITY